MSKPMTYDGSGVRYADLDPFKKLAQLAAAETAGNIERLDLRDVPESRGESAYLVDMGGYIIAHVEEGLGTQNLVADALCEQSGNAAYYRASSIGTIAMIVNDMITSGALPVSIAMHLAVGDSAWLADDEKVHQVISGWKEGCFLAGCAWGGGETPVLRDVVYPNTAVWSGSAWGIIRPKKRWIRCTIKDGDAIVLFESSGIHCNGLTMARDIAAKLPDGYFTKMDNGVPYGAALLEPTCIYVPLIELLLIHGVSIHYAVNMTGHGWRKLMRADKDFTYRIHELPPVPEVLRFMVDRGPIAEREAYKQLNMGAGFAIYVPIEEVNDVIAIAETCGFKAYHAGTVVFDGGPKRVVIEPKQITFTAEDLQIR
ncbi:MAG: phosphoribosylformylglycinamidine cyclo-ligase [Candidatus Komeilibacteria bacterium]|nr:phosphoribosylformylglycinamidine cyclo-ligase [Candidatus Komeilibacteria bacterium]